MTGFIKLLLILGLVSFFSYTFYVEPNAADDPAGAVSRSANRLATFCDRNREECEFAGDVGEGIGRAVGIGWKLVTGQGRLVYVANDGSSYDAAPRPPTEAAPYPGNSKYRLPQLPNIFSNSRSTDGNYRLEQGRSNLLHDHTNGHRPARLNSDTAEQRSPSSLGDLIRSTR